MKHLRILERAGLVLVERRRRQRWNHLNAVPIRRIYERGISAYAARWAASLLGLKRHIERGSAQRGREQRWEILSDCLAYVERGQRKGLRR